MTKNMTIFGQLILLFSTFGHFMLQQSDRKAQLFNLFIGVVALKSDSLWFLFGQLMVQVTNCQFGLRFLEACGVSASYKNTYSEITEDPQDPGIFIITTYYHFPTDTSLSIGNESLLFRQGQSLRWLESRRFDKHKVERHLTKYGLQSFGYKDLDNHALFLCGTHHHHRV